MAVTQEPFRPHRLRLYLAVDAERDRQDIRWGDARTRNIPLTVMLVVLSEEVGEVAKAILHGPIDGREPIRAELLQVAAVALAMVEGLDGTAPLGVANGEAG